MNAIANPKVPVQSVMVPRFDTNPKMRAEIKNIGYFSYHFWGILEGVGELTSCYKRNCRSNNSKNCIFNIFRYQNATTGELR